MGEIAGFNAEIERDSRVIAAEINQIKAQARATLVRSAVEIGKRLAEAKEIIPYGEWGEWLKENVDYSERTAQNLMGCWETYGKRGSLEAMDNVSMSNAVALLGASPETRAELIESGEAESLSVRALKERIAEMEAELDNRQMRLDELLGLEERADEAEKALSDAEDTRAQAMAAIADAKKAIEEKAAIEARAKDAAETLRRTMAENSDLRRKLDAAAEDKKTAVDKAAWDAEEKKRKELTALKDELEKTKSALTEAENRAPETVTAYETPPEVEKELERLRGIAAKAPNETAIRLRDGYNRALSEFNQIKTLLGELDEGEAAKYRAAIAAGLKKMAEAIEGRK